MEVVDNEEIQKTELFRQYLNCACNEQLEGRFYLSLKGSQFGEFQQRGQTQELITKFRIMHTLYRKQQRKKWHQIEKQILTALIAATCSRQGLEVKQLPDSCWEDIAKFMLWDSANCRKRWLSVLQQTEITPWTEEEDRLLNGLVKNQRAELKWVKISQQLNQLNPKNKQVYRSSKCCRERWFNHLDPEVVKGNWQDEDDLQILSLIQQHGKKWSKISKLTAKSRTQNSIKNRYNALVKQVRNKGKYEDEKQINHFLIKERKKRVAAKKSKTLACPPKIEPSQEDEDLNILRRKPQVIDPKIVSELNRSIGGVLPTMLHTSPSVYLGSMTASESTARQSKVEGRELKVRVVESMSDLERGGWQHCMVNMERRELMFMQKGDMVSEGLSEVRTPYPMMMMGSPVILMNPIKYL